MQCKVSKYRPNRGLKMRVRGMARTSRVWLEVGVGGKTRRKFRAIVVNRGSRD